MTYTLEAMRLLAKQLRDPVLHKGGIRPAYWALADALEFAVQEITDLRARVKDLTEE